MRLIVSLLLLLTAYSPALAECNPWYDTCRDLVVVHLPDEVSDLLSMTIPIGVQEASSELDLTPKESLDMCHAAIATALQESNFQFAIGRAGEVGIYQFKLPTVRLVLARYGLAFGTNSDEDIVRKLLDSSEATYLFVLHFAWLMDRTNGHWSSWYVYNSGKHAKRYANQAIARYNKVRKSSPRACYE